jgi:hypothetical protein
MSGDNMETKEQIISLFNNESDKESIGSILNIDISTLTSGMTAFQIEHFVLNKKEFCNPLFQYQQAKLEIMGRINTFLDFYYQFREAKAKIKLAEGRIEELNSNIDLNNKVKEAKTELQNIEIEKNTFKLKSIEAQAKDKLRESLVFYKTYDKYRYIENLPKEEIAKMEAEGWMIKSAYFQELVDRYQLTPNGFLKLPHADKGLEGLLSAYNGNNNQPQLQLKDGIK